MGNSDTGTETTTREMDERGRLTIPQPIRRLFNVDQSTALLVLEIEVRKVLAEDHGKDVADLPTVPATIEISDRGHLIIPEAIRRFFRIKNQRAVLRLEIKDAFVFEAVGDE